MKATNKIRGVAISIALGAISFFIIWRHDRIAESYNFHCFNNALMIDTCKEQWALDHQATDGAIVTTNDIATYSRDRGNFVCMRGGTISIGRIGEEPTCSFHGGHKDIVACRNETRWLFHKMWP